MCQCQCQCQSMSLGGPTEVVSEMLKAAGEIGIMWMTDVCNAVVRDG